MTSEERRQALLRALEEKTEPVSASALARAFAVSRQIVVGDVALLRAAGAEIAATPRGYLLQRQDQDLVRQLACRHAAEDMERELNIMVDNGCTVLDVVVEHPVYGQLTGSLHLHSRYDVRQFIAKAAQARPLSLLTEGVHLHTLSCPDEAAFQRCVRELSAAGFLWEK